MITSKRLLGTNMSRPGDRVNASPASVPARGAYITPWKPPCHAINVWSSGGAQAPQRRQLVIVAAKKGARKGGKKEGGGRKGPGSLMDIAKPKQPFEDVQVVMLNLLMVESFRRNVGRPLLEDIEITEAAKAMYNADIAIIACDRGLSEEPKITYINQAAADLLGRTWGEVINSPAKVLFDMDAPELSAAHENGSMTGFDGPLVTASGSVTITNADVWTIESPAAAGEEGQDDVDASAASRGKVMGQGWVFSTWNLPDGTKSGVGMSPVAIPTPDEIKAAEKAVVEQGDKVRTLKDSGLTNQDEEVQDAVAELLARKAALSEMLDMLSASKEQ